MGSGKKRKSVISKKKQAKAGSSGNSNSHKSKNKTTSLLKSFGGVAVFKGGTGGGLGGKQKNATSQLFATSFRKAVGKASNKKKQPDKAASKTAATKTTIGKKRSASDDAMEDDDEDTNRSMAETFATQKSAINAESADFDTEMSNLRERAMADGEWTVVENHKKKKKKRRKMMEKEETSKEGGRQRKAEEETTPLVSNPLFGSLNAPSFGRGSESYDPVGEAAKLMMSSGTLQEGGTPVLFTVGTTNSDTPKTATDTSKRKKRQDKKATRKLTKALANRFSLLEDKDDDNDEGWGEEFDTSTTTLKKKSISLAPPRFAFDAPSLTAETSLVKAMGGTTVTHTEARTTRKKELFVFGANEKKTESVTGSETIPFLTFGKGAATTTTTAVAAPDDTKKTPFFAFASASAGLSFSNPGGISTSTSASKPATGAIPSSSALTFQFAPPSFTIPSTTNSDASKTGSRTPEASTDMDPDL